MNRRALLVVDMLNDFVREGAPLEVPCTRRILPALRREIQRSRGGGDAIVYVSDAHAPDDPEFSRMGWPPHAVKGTKGAEVTVELAPQPGDPVVEKTTYSGFFRTKLDDVLSERGVTDLTIAGCVTNICVLYTVSDAVLRGYRVTVREDCVAGLSEEDHRWALRQMREVLGATVI